MQIPDSESAAPVEESSSLRETLYVISTHGGDLLTASADAARRGETEAHELLDPDV